MRLATLILQWIVRISGIAQIVTGVLFWTGHAIDLVPLHMTVGLTITLALLMLTILAATARAPKPVIGAGILLVIALPALGMTQTGLLVGGWHWVIRILHLLVGLAALRLGESLANLILRGTVHARHTRFSA